MLGAIGWRVIPRIEIGPLSVSPHGVGIAVGYAAGGVLTARRAERLHGISPEHVWNMLMWAVLGVIVGARLFYVVGHLGDYIPRDPLGIVRVWEGGLVFYGGAFGGILAAVPYMRKHGLPFWKLMDAAAPGFPLGLIFGRIGDLVIGDHLGNYTDLPFGYRYEGGELPGPFYPPLGSVVHQTALYDLVSVSLLLPVVLWLGRRARPDGFLILFTAAWYATGRLISDFAREPTADVYLGLRGTQWVSVALLLVAVAGLIRRARAAPPLPEAAPSLPEAKPVGASEPDREVTAVGSTLDVEEVQAAQQPAEQQPPPEAREEP